MKKKIAIITQYWKNSSGGGVRNYLIGLIDEIEKQGYPIIVLFEKGTDDNNFNVDVNKYLFPLKSLRILIKERPDIVHSQNTWYCLLTGIFYKFLFKKKIIHTFHTCPVEKISIIEKFLMQILIDKCDVVTFVSSDMKDKMKKVWNIKFKNTFITYPGVNEIDINSNEINDFIEQFSIEKFSPILLSQGFFANIYKVKGVKLLMLAVRLLRNYHPNLLLILTGDGYYLKECIKFSKDNNLNNMVLFTGEIQNPFIALAICDIYTHISLADGVPLSILESMIMGKPIIATKIGGIPETIENGMEGLLIEPKVNEIADTIDYLLKNKNIADKLGNNGKIKALNKFSWKNSAEKFIKIYEEC